jgi:hypothetical protein
MRRPSALAAGIVARIVSERDAGLSFRTYCRRPDTRRHRDRARWAIVARQHCSQSACHPSRPVLCLTRCNATRPKSDGERSDGLSAGAAARLQVPRAATHLREFVSRCRYPAVAALAIHGHAKVITTLAIYTHLFDDDHAETMAALGPMATQYPMPPTLCCCAVSASRCRRLAQSPAAACANLLGLSRRRLRRA